MSTVINYEIVSGLFATLTIFLIILMIATLNAFISWRVNILRRKLYDILYVEQIDPELLAEIVYGANMIQLIRHINKITRPPKASANMAVICLFGGMYDQIMKS